MGNTERNNPPQVVKMTIYVGINQDRWQKLEESGEKDIERLLRHDIDNLFCHGNISKLGDSLISPFAPLAEESEIGDYY